MAVMLLHGLVGSVGKREGETRSMTSSTNVQEMHRSSLFGSIEKHRLMEIHALDHKESIANLPSIDSLSRHCISMERSVSLINTCVESTSAFCHQNEDQHRTTWWVTCAAQISWSICIGDQTPHACHTMYIFAEEITPQCSAESRMNKDFATSQHKTIIDPPTLQTDIKNDLK